MINLGARKILPFSRIQLRGRFLLSHSIPGSKLPDMEDLGAVHVNLGGVYLKKGLYDEAKKFCEEGLKIATNRNNQECLDEANECLQTVKKFLKS